ncbi:unnamed protein product [Cylindrotheca closterium]|uniref:Uncharacterized protein n=1 Tax=Cylindrotheca closterium TaxID=2856 RepID=A0AAD2CV40_9STRA|nr:unnamed protein product [Cylindrotheca closterium]
MSENDLAGLDSGVQQPLIDSGSNGTKPSSPMDKDPAAKFRFLISIVGILFLACCMYFWNEHMAQSFDVQSMQTKSGQATKKYPAVVTSAPIQSPPVEAPSPKEATEPDIPSESPPIAAPVESVKETQPPALETEAPNDTIDKATDAPALETEAPNNTTDKASEAPALETEALNNTIDKATEAPAEASPATETDSLAEESSATKSTPIESDGTCDALCDKREEARISKFGGDLLNVTDVVRMAKQAKDEAIANIRELYGTYFDDIFVKSASEAPRERYIGLKPIDKEKSPYRLRRKLKLKVLRAMEEVRETESNVLGCDCVQRQGKATGSPDESVESIPDFYGQYVFANGGHSQAAAHGNPYSESYTAVLTEDLKPVWKAMGIDFVGRNYAVGGMPATPIMSTCSKEIFGTDIDFLVWNYGMTDKNRESTMYYLYRAAVNPGRPAFLIIDPMHHDSNAAGLVTQGSLSIHSSKVETKNVPDSSPDGIPLSQKEMDAMPPLLQYLKVNKALEGSNKWSCTKAMKDAGSDCKCWDLGGRTGWHAGYKLHALQGRQISLPFMNMLDDALEEIIQSPKDAATLLSEIEEEENAEFENFISLPVIGKDGGKGSYDMFSESLGLDLLETWFKGPSICRTAQLPAESRFLGITTNTNKTGSVARCGEETYDTGIMIDRNQYPDTGYTYPEGIEPVPGEFSIIGWSAGRYCADEEDCPEIVQPDYPDWFWGVWKDGKTSTTFPNEKEKEYYGYDADKFKGIIGLIPTLFPEIYQKNTPYIDFKMKDFRDHVKMKVNGKSVAKYRPLLKMVILEDENGSVQWPPNENGQYILEFEAFGVMEIDNRTSAEHRLRLSGFVLY